MYMQQTTLSTFSLSLDTKKSITLKAPITPKVVGFCRLLKCLRSLLAKQCKHRPDCSYKQCGSSSDCSCRSRLSWAHTICTFSCIHQYYLQRYEADSLLKQMSFSDVFLLLALKGLIHVFHNASHVFFQTY